MKKKHRENKTSNEILKKEQKLHKHKQKKAKLLKIETGKGGKNFNGLNFTIFFQLQCLAWGW